MDSSEKLLEGMFPTYTTLLEPHWNGTDCWLGPLVQWRLCAGGGAADLDGGVAGGVTDADRAAAHRRCNVGVVEAGHGFSLFFRLKLQVRLPQTTGYHGNSWEQQPA